jgi:hypothetical protein
VTVLAQRDRAELDVHESGSVGSANTAAVDARGTPQRPHGPAEVVIVDRAVHQRQLIESARPGFVAVHVGRDLHFTKIPDLAAAVTLVTSARTSTGPKMISERALPGRG